MLTILLHSCIGRVGLRTLYTWPGTALLTVQRAEDTSMPCLMDILFAALLNVLYML